MDGIKAADILHGKIIFILAHGNETVAGGLKACDFFFIFIIARIQKRTAVKSTKKLRYVSCLNRFRIISAAKLLLFFDVNYSRLKINIFVLF